MNMRPFPLEEQEKKRQSLQCDCINMQLVRSPGEHHCANGKPMPVTISAADVGAHAVLLDGKAANK